MKPHLIRHRGIWHCLVRGSGTSVCGLGYTPDAAYEDWKRLIAKTEEA